MWTEHTGCGTDYRTAATAGTDQQQQVAAVLFAVEDARRSLPRSLPRSQQDDGRRQAAALLDYGKRPGCCGESGGGAGAGRWDAGESGMACRRAICSAARLDWRLAGGIPRGCVSTDRSGRCGGVMRRSTVSRAAASRARRVSPRRCGSHALLPSEFGLPECHATHSRREHSWAIPDVRLWCRCTDGCARCAKLCH